MCQYIYDLAIFRVVKLTNVHCGKPNLSFALLSTLFRFWILFSALFQWETFCWIYIVDSFQQLYTKGMNHSIYNAFPCRKFYVLTNLS